MEEVFDKLDVSRLNDDGVRSVHGAVREKATQTSTGQRRTSSALQTHIRAKHLQTLTCGRLRMNLSRPATAASSRPREAVHSRKSTRLVV